MTLFLMTFFVDRCPSFVDYVRATSFLVFAGWLLVFVVYGYGIIAQFYEKHVGRRLPLPVIVGVDFVCHVLPVVVLGLPKTPVAMLCGVATTLIWYMAVRNQIHVMYYLPEEHLVYRDFFAVGGSLWLAALKVLTG
jgi:hypothetical protein